VRKKTEPKAPKAGFSQLLAELAHAPARRLSARPRLSRGRKLGRYQLQEKLGQGASGWVFQALDRELDREVALKIFRASALAGEVDRVRREALALAAVSHPNVVTVYDAGAADGYTYLALELSRHGTLAQRIASGPLPVEQIGQLVQQLCAGLVALHAAGIVHRDLKPDNVLIFEGDQAKIADFGLAKLHGTRRSLGRARTQTGTLLGTVHYMSPEQVRGERADVRSDVFSFGAVLYELLVGSRPFAANSPAETLSAILRDEPVEPSFRNAPVHQALFAVARRCLQKSPEARWSSSVQLAAAVQTALSSEPAHELALASIQGPVPTHYAKSGNVHVAYQCIGDGADYIIGVPPLTSNIEVMWESPEAKRFIRKLGALGRYVHFDKRGTGMSDPVPPVPLSERVDDLVSVMDAERIERAFVGGVSEGGPMCLVFANLHPERTRGLILINSFARMTPALDYPFGRERADFEGMIEAWAARWGTPETLTARFFFASRADDPQFVASWVNRYERQCNSPGTLKALMHMNLDIDIRSELARVRTPTLIIHRRGDPAVPVEHGRYLAQHIPNAQYVELDGVDHAPWEGDQDAVLKQVAEFIARHR
jgi:serine/threonine protein kinase/alpha-beta hydrolase superfamily lysophospholipase